MYTVAEVLWSGNFHNDYKHKSANDVNVHTKKTPVP